MERQKRAHQKVRTGCHNCKRRRVKCDESRPKCFYCQKWGWDCIYSPPQPWLFQPTERGNWEDRRALSFFREKTAPLFCGDQRFSSEFFTRFVPQIAASDLTVWHLTVAMGARHEENLHLANKHHSAALWIMSRSLSQMPVDVALLCCMLLGCHANISGEDPSVSVYHLRKGLSILQETGGKRSSQTLSHFVDPMFANLELTFAFLGPPKKWDSLMPYHEEKPKILFSDLMTARSCFYDILRWRFYIMLSTDDQVKTLKETDEMFETWRLMMVELAKTEPKAEAMLFEYKMLGMCREASSHIQKSRVKVLLVDLSSQSQIDMVCSFTGDASPAWKPLEEQSGDITIWPKGTVTGINGDARVIRITFSRDMVSTA